MAVSILQLWSVAVMATKVILRGAYKVQHNLWPLSVALVTHVR